MTSQNQWEDFLNPTIAQERLIFASLYITGYEMLKDSVVGRIKDFYCDGFSEGNLTFSPDYQKKVLDLNKSPLYASLQWLKNSEAIDESDIKIFEDLKKHRNLLVHELPELIFSGKLISSIDHFQKAIELLRKIETWWLINVEIPINPGFDGADVNPDEVLAGPVMMMQIMLEVLSGNETLLKQFQDARDKYP